VLSDYVFGSLQLMLGVAIITLLLGIGSAWLVTQYRFFGSGFFNWALLLPLAMPTYITAYSYTGLLDVAGPVQSAIRSSLGLSFNDYWFPEIRSMGGAIFVMSFVLYPYVYMLARASFIDQSKSLSDAGQLLGLSRRQSFFRITLPIARPAVIAGVSLALMETLADYGAVSYFSVSTFTTGIFRTWYGLDSVQTAAQLSLMLLMFVIVLITVEKNSRKKARYHDKSRGKSALPKQLDGRKQLVAFVLASIPLLLGFVIPVSQLAIWAIQTHEQLFETSFWVLVMNTLTLATITSILALILALILAYGHRIVGKPVTRLALRLGHLGYAIPGTVIAVGTLIPLARLDNQIDAWFRANFDISTGLLISGSIAALIIAYLVRFLAVSLNAIESSLSSIALTMDQAARSLGLSPLQILRKVHIPMLKTGLFTGLLVVFVDVMKELPATLILRPFNFNTLAVRAYELASDERLADASLASLAIVLVGLVPVILLSRGMLHSAADKPLQT
jgi:iron(III) transport system permease protein